MARTRLGTLRQGLSVIVLLGLVWFLSREFNRVWATLRGFELHVSYGPTALGLGLGVIGFLIETLAWQLTMNELLERREFSFAESIAIANTSGLLKYIPGRVWTYGAQMLWLSRRGISKATVVYANLLLMMCSMLVSMTLGGGYLIARSGIRYRELCWTGLALGHLLCVFIGPALLLKVLGLLRMSDLPDASLVKWRSKLVLGLDAAYILSWLVIGAAAYWTGRGVALTLSVHDVLAITASMSVSWIAGYLSALTPGGLGVREGLMYLMLQGVSQPATAVILPVVSRLLYIVIEVALGAIGLAIGTKRKLFAASPTP